MDRFEGFPVFPERRPPEEYRLLEPEHGWRKLVIIVFTILSILVGADTIESFYCSNQTFEHASKFPTINQTEEYYYKGMIVFVTPEEKRLVDILRIGAGVGIPSLFGLGFIMKKFMGINVFGEQSRPTAGDESSLWDRWETPKKD
jgi:hypothetical protein